MSKRLKDLKWESVAFDDFPVSMSDKGFVGLEECTSYGLEKESKKPSKKQKKQKKRKKPDGDQDSLKIPDKKVKLSNGFIVESCGTIRPSVTNTTNVSPEVNKTNKEQGQGNQTEGEAQDKIKDKKNKRKLGEDISKVVSNLTPEDMLTWAEFKLPEPIVRTLMELGFKQPTKIQQLSLPAAILGRRDILGAAETGSGKTLAFGLPILNGIMKLKEKAEAGLDVYEIPYKKTSIKKKNDVNDVSNKSTEKKKKKYKKVMAKKKKVEKAKESSEDGYSSGDKCSDEDDESNRHDNTEQNKKKHIESSEKDDDYIEEIEVPIRRRETSDDEGNDSDDDSNYIHLSDMLDSDELGDTSDESENEEASTDVNMSDGNVSDDQSDDNVKSSDEISNNANDSEDEVHDGEEEQGIGCVKVIDNVEIPGHVVTKTGKPLYALILTPTRELAIQISRHLIAVAKYTGIKIATIVGGMAAVKQERVLKGGPEVVVATPGRLWELLNQGQPHLQQMDSVKFLAIDETDRMIERGHFEELQPLLERLNADDGRRSTRQNFVFSATLTMVHELPAHMRGKKVTKNGKIINRKIEKMTPQQKIKRLINMIGMTDPKVVDITTQNLGTAETLTESRITCSLDQKDAYLYYILKRHPGRTIVFCNSIGCVRRLAQLFTLLKCRPLPLHASMAQRQRLKNLERFRDDPHGILVATDVAARGLDIPNVDHVIHYQVPRTAENYVHRSGRTARASKEGITILMMEPSEAYLYMKLCRTLNKTSELPTFPVPSSSLSSLKDLVKLAREVDALELKRRRATQAVGWRDKAAKEMDIIIDDDDLPVQNIDPSIDKALKAKRQHLESMLRRPLFPKGFSFKYPTLNDPNMFATNDDNALQTMKKALESGELKKEKRKSKNAPLLKLQKTLMK